MDRQALSDALGALSILTWLGAQSPQIYKNWKAKSVEGLALPFLVSWFLGDFTNFLGCILTHQLPMQLYLSIYFLFVDVALCGQFVFYSRTTLPPLSEDYPYAHAHAPSSALHHRRSRSRPRHSRKKSGRSTSGTGKSTPPYTPAMSGAEDDPMQRSWMSQSSSASASAHTSPAFSHRPLPSRSSSAYGGFVESPTTSTAPSTVPPSPTIPERGRTLSRPHYVARTFDPSLQTIHGSPSTNGAFMHPSLHQHHPQLSLQGSHVSFDVDGGAQGDHVGMGEDSQLLDSPRQSRQRTSSSRSRPPPPSRRSTSVVFLSVGALVTFGTGAFSGGGLGTMDVGRAGQGRAWSTARWTQGADDAALSGREAQSFQPRHPALLVNPPSPPSVLDRVLPARRIKRSAMPASPSSLLSPSPLSSTSSTSTAFASRRQHDDDEDPHDPHDHPPPGVDWERVIGRFSAWACTTFYLTSRLPQLWQNFRRRSVEGLAMTLFLFACIGNTLYVLSILTSPLAASEPGYLLESTPYLLGSGGTLCFDLAILAQSYLYSEKRRGRKERERRRRNVEGVEAEEEAALLATEGDDDDATVGARRLAPPRSRSTSANGFVGTGGHRSRSSTGGAGGRSRQTSTASSARSKLRRSDSTEMARPSSRPPAPFTSLEPEGGANSHDFAPGAGSEGEGRSVSRGRHVRTLSAASGSAEEAIPEESESTVTILIRP
ncbi:hypothetical protein JCM8097_006071 [Rhodosporidiobolus ruineniae]